MSTPKQQQEQQKLANKSVYRLYLVIVAILGLLGALSMLIPALIPGSGNSTVTTSIVTALTTVAGFAVGDVANDSKPAK
jgi:type II secretory pathway component PulF